MKFFFLFLSCSLYLNISNAAYYDTLPEGVRNITYRFIQTGEITGSYGSSGDFKGYNVNANINADSIKGVNTAVDTYLNGLSPADYASFSFGTFQGSATSKVSAQAFGAGYGVTNRFTVYGFIPFYSAQVDLKIERTQKGRNNVGTAIQLENLPDVDIRLIQSLFVNYYHYQPLGKWKATDFGDAELGMMYQLKKWSNAGALINFGTVAPTGRKDNPDILQDIAFGDGQWDAFFEWGGGINLSGDWSLDNWTRYTYQFPYTATVRTPDSSTFPVTANKGEARIKLGNKAQTNLQCNYKLSEQWMTSLAYSFEYTEPTDYKSSNPRSDAILETDTEKLTHIARLNLGYSTLALYLQKRFFAPISFNLAVQSIFAGKNVPKYERADFEVRLFF
ncbi:MAG: hypothetical protein PHY93_08445 [Bacteriovorax sp.]|nr:hypothetical protein [Bacteriovorax sp.]